jgi:hypothetical protein
MAGASRHSADFGHPAVRISQLAQQTQPLVAGVRYYFAHADVAPLADASPFPRARGDETLRVASHQHAPATPYLPRLDSDDKVMECDSEEVMECEVMNEVKEVLERDKCDSEEVAECEEMNEVKEVLERDRCDSEAVMECEVMNEVKEVMERDKCDSEEVMECEEMNEVKEVLERDKCDSEEVMECDSEEASTHDCVNSKMLRQTMAYLRHETGRSCAQVAVAEVNWKQVLAQIGIAQKTDLPATAHSAP